MAHWYDIIVRKDKIRVRWLRYGWEYGWDMAKVIKYIGENGWDVVKIISEKWRRCRLDGKDIGKIWARW